MLGIKKGVKFTLAKLAKGKLSNDIAIRELMEYFDADEYGHRAKTSKADLGYGWIHYAFVRTVKPRRVLCIGSRHGFIPAVVAQACRDNRSGHVDFVDPGFGPGDKNHWTGKGLWKTNKGRNLFKDFGLGKFIKLSAVTTSEYVKKNKKTYDYIYIDGDHSYKGVSTDYRLLWPRLKKHGFMAFHDVNVVEKKPEGVYGIHKLWKEISKRNAFILPFKGSGLGVIQKVSQ